MCFWLSTRTRNDGTSTTCLPTLHGGERKGKSSASMLLVPLNPVMELSSAFCEEYQPEDSHVEAINNRVCNPLTMLSSILLDLASLLCILIPFYMEFSLCEILASTLSLFEWVAYAVLFTLHISTHAACNLSFTATSCNPQASTPGICRSCPKHDSPYCCTAELIFTR